MFITNITAEIPETSILSHPLIEQIEKSIRVFQKNEIKEKYRTF